MSKDFFGHSVYFLTETPGERRLNPVTTAAGIFQPLRHYVPPPLYFCCKIGVAYKKIQRNYLAVNDRVVPLYEKALPGKERVYKTGSAPPARDYKRCQSTTFMLLSPYLTM